LLGKFGCFIYRDELRISYTYTKIGRSSFNIVIILSISILHSQSVTLVHINTSSTSGLATLRD